MRVHEVATYGTILSPMLFDPRSELLVGVSVVVHIVTRWYWAFELVHQTRLLGILTDRPGTEFRRQLQRLVEGGEFDRLRWVYR